jgi:uncharacterized RDD family membrane protein YckC
MNGKIAMPETEVPPGIQIVPGVASKDRFFAATFDELFIVIAGLATAMAIPDDQIVSRGAALVAIFLGYFFLFEALVGTTPGKLVFGLWVRRVEGGRCSWQQAIVRTLARVFEVNPLLLGALPAAIAILASANRQRLGDMLAGTVVRKGRDV